MVWSDASIAFPRDVGVNVATLTIYDLSGRLVRSITPGKGNVRLADFGFAQGVYLTRFNR